MYRWLVRRALEWMLADLRRGRTRVFVKLLADDVRFRFPGDHSWAADDQGKEAVARWLERYVRTGLRLYPREIVVSGPPWNIRSAPGSSMRPVGTTARLSIATKGCSSTGSCAGASRNTSPSRTPRRPPSSTPTCAAPGRFEAPMAARPHGRRGLLRVPPRTGLWLLQLAPTARAVIGDDLLEQRAQRLGIDLLALVVGDRSCRFVVVAGGDDALGVGDDAAVVEEQVDVVFGRQQRADVALEDEVGLHRSLDRLHHLRVGGVNEVTQPLADVLLPGRQFGDVVIDARVALVSRRRCSLSHSDDVQLSCSTDRMFPAGSLNHAMSGAWPDSRPRMIPLSSVGNSS